MFEIFSFLLQRFVIRMKTTIYYLFLLNNSFDSAIASFKDASASSVNWFVDVTIFKYGFCEVVKNETKLAQ